MGYKYFSGIIDSLIVLTIFLVFLVPLVLFLFSLYYLFQFLFPYLNHTIIYLLSSLFLTVPSLLFLFLISLSHFFFQVIFLNFSSLILFALPQNLFFIAAKFSFLANSSNSSIIFSPFSILVSMALTLLYVLGKKVVKNLGLQEADSNIRKVDNIDKVSKTK